MLWTKPKRLKGFNPRSLANESCLWYCDTTKVLDFLLSSKPTHFCRLLPFGTKALFKYCAASVDIWFQAQSCFCLGRCLQFVQLSFGEDQTCGVAKCVDLRSKSWRNLHAGAHSPRVSTRTRLRTRRPYLKILSSSMPACCHTYYLALRIQKHSISLLSRIDSL